MSVSYTHLRAYALLLAAALLFVGLCGCRIESISSQLKELYSVYMDSAQAPTTSPDYENFRRIFPLAVWEIWKEEDVYKRQHQAGYGAG